MRIAPPAPDDIAAMIAVMEAAFDPRFGEAWSATQLNGALAMPETWALIAREDATVVGFALARHAVDEAELMLVAVAPSSRRRGWGARLLEKIREMARLRGAVALFLEVRGDNGPAIRLYDAAGFVEVGRRKDYYCGAAGERFDAITMRLPL